jgi:hypothetical protein
MIAAGFMTVMMYMVTAMAIITMRISMAIATSQMAMSLVDTVMMAMPDMAIIRTQAMMVTLMVTAATT